MNDSLYDRLHRGEDATASTLGAPIEPTAVVAKVRRRRATHVLTAGTAALAAVGTGAAAAFAWLPTASDPAADGAAPSSQAPSPSVSWSPSPEPSGPVHQYGDDPTGWPVLEPASQEVADATIDPRPGPAFVVGAPRDVNQVLRPDAVAECVDASCGMGALPPITADVMDSGKLTAVAFEWGIVSLELEPGSQLFYVALSGPEVGSFMAFDFGAWAADAGLGADGRNVTVTDLAFDPVHHVIGGSVDTYVPGSDYQTTNQSMFVMWNLDTGESTIVAEGLDHTSVTWDGSNWRLFGYGPEGTLGALVSADGTSWTADGVDVANGWWLVEGPEYDTLYARTIGARLMLLNDVAYPAEPEGDLSFCNPPHEASAEEGYVRTWCAPAGLDGDALLDPANQVLYQLTAGEGWAPADATAVADAPPASTMVGQVRNGYVLRHNGGIVYREGGVDTPIAAPSVDPWVSDPANGGVWMLGYDQVGWIGEDLTYTQMLSYDPDVMVVTIYPMD